MFLHTNTENTNNITCLCFCANACGMCFVCVRNLCTYVCVCAWLCPLYPKCPYCVKENCVKLPEAIQPIIAGLSGSDSYPSLPFSLLLPPSAPPSSTPFLPSIYPTNSAPPLPPSLPLSFLGTQNSFKFVPCWPAKPLPDF